MGLLMIFFERDYLKHKNEKTDIYPYLWIAYAG